MSDDDRKRAEEYRRQVYHNSELYDPCKFHDATGATSFEDLVERAYLAGLEEGRREERKRILDEALRITIDQDIGKVSLYEIKKMLSLPVAPKGEE